MKVLIVVALLAAVSASFAQGTREMSEDEFDRYWFLFLPPLPRAERIQFLSQSGMSETGVEELTRYLERSWKDMERFWKASSDDICANLNKYKRSRDAFADKYVREDAEELALKKALIANIPIVLSVDDEVRLRAWLPTIDMPTKAEMPMSVVDLIRFGGLYNPAEDIVCEDGKPRQVTRK